jgi:cytochrome c peroxidase
MTTSIKVSVRSVVTKHLTLTLSVLMPALIVFALAGCRESQESVEVAVVPTVLVSTQNLAGDASGEDQAVELNEPIQPIPPAAPYADARERAKVQLGKVLFHDARLSIDNSISCATCHNVSGGGDDGRETAVGVYGQALDVNSATVFNAVYNFAHAWDGRTSSLTEQITTSVHDPKEMGSNWNEVVSRLQADKRFDEYFRTVYPNGINAANVIDAITRYEARLVTPDARFDQYLLGDLEAITAEEKAGYRLFKDLGCISCHHGRNVGGNSYQQLGVMDNYFENRKLVLESDAGRFNVTQRTEDMHRFKVPSLRNVALTRPYFHDGSAKSLNDAVRLMGQYQLGLELPEEDIQQLVSFLKSLTGELDRKLKP